MELSIVIVNYKSKIVLANCLASVFKSDLNGLNYEIILVENNSGDDLNEFLENKAVKLIISKRNLGMGKGNNLGIKAASGEYILILNPDTVLSKETIKILLNYLKSHSEVGLIGPKLFYPDGKLQLSCARFPKFLVPILRRTFLGDYFKKTRDEFTMSNFDHNNIKEVDWLMGSCLLFKRKINLANGQEFFPLFDKRYFMYFEDIDLARTFKSKGFKVIYHPEAIVIHDHARESAKDPWYIAIFKNKLTWIHILSWFKYFIKWGFNPNVKQKDI